MQTILLRVIYVDDTYNNRDFSSFLFFLKMIPFANEIWNVIYNNSRENYDIYLSLTNFTISKSLAFKLVTFIIFLCALNSFIQFTVFYCLCTFTNLTANY